MYKVTITGVDPREIGHGQLSHIIVSALEQYVGPPAKVHVEWENDPQDVVIRADNRSGLGVFRPDDGPPF